MRVEASFIGIGGGVSGEVKLLISNVSLQASSSDMWLRRPNTGDGYTVCGAYQMLMQQEMHDHDVVSDAVWHKHVPLKVSICVWRLFRNRWSIKDNLQLRNIIPLDAQLCISGCGQIETTEHLFIHCPIFCSLWQLVKSQHVRDHFHQFIYSSGGHISRCSFLHMIWLCCIWVLWDERNHRLFIMLNQLCN